MGREWKRSTNSDDSSIVTEERMQAESSPSTPAKFFISPPASVSEGSSTRGSSPARRKDCGDGPCPTCGHAGGPSSSAPAPPPPPAPQCLSECEQERLRKDEEELRHKKRNNGWYLSIILGNSIDLTMSSTDRYHFKRDYEKFKLRVTLLILLTLVFALLFPTKASDAVCIFLMVWYYCTLTIRESILILNGSNIHWWWVAHHYLATVLAGVTLTWPENDEYKEFRPQFGLFTLYICGVQQLQYQYQSGCLRRLHALGSLGAEMDVTLEGFASWMFHGLTFLLPFLAVAYLGELYNAYSLARMWAEKEVVWQVLALAILFGIVGAGNLIMVAGIVWAKMLETPAMRRRSLRSKYPSMMSIVSLLRRTSESSEDEKEKKAKKQKAN